MSGPVMIRVFSAVMTIIASAAAGGLQSFSACPASAFAGWPTGCLLGALHLFRLPLHLFGLFLHCLARIFHLLAADTHFAGELARGIGCAQRQQADDRCDNTEDHPCFFGRNSVDFRTDNHNVIEADCKRYNGAEVWDQADNGSDWEKGGKMSSAAVCYFIILL